MKCRQCKRAIRSLICGNTADGDLIQQHLATCARCAEKYGHVLPLIRSGKSVPAPPLTPDAWKQFSAQLHRRIRQERPAPIGWLRSLLLSIGEWKLVRFRKAAAASVVALAFALGITQFLRQPVHESPATKVVKAVSTPEEAPLPELPPEIRDVISVFGPEGFVTGAELGFIRPGDYFQGHKIEQYEFYEALDFLYNLS